MPTTTTAPRLTLKRFKHFPSLSEETTAFSADVYFDRTRIASAENRGEGGSTFVTLTYKGSTSAIVNAARDIVRADCLATIADPRSEGWLRSFASDTLRSLDAARGPLESLEQAVDCLVSEALRAKEAARIDRWIAKQSARLRGLGATIIFRYETPNGDGIGVGGARSLEGISAAQRAAKGFVILVGG